MNLDYFTQLALEQCKGEGHQDPLYRQKPICYFMVDPPYPQLYICRFNQLQIPDVFSEKVLHVRNSGSLTPCFSRVNCHHFKE